jgi:hypothetical protein
MRPIIGADKGATDLTVGTVVRFAIYVKDAICAGVGLPLYKDIFIGAGIAILFINIKLFFIHFV